MSNSYKKISQVENTLRGQRRFLRSIRRKNRRKGYSGLGRPKKIKHRKKQIFTKPPVTKVKNHSHIVQFISSKKDFFTKLPVSLPPNGIINIPKIFSLHEKPEDSFYFLKRLFHALKNPVNDKLYINYEDCERIDLCASVCMDIILKDFIDHYISTRAYGYNPKIHEITGIHLNNEKIKRFIFAIGAHKTILGLKVNFDDIITYDLHKGFKSMGSGYKEIESTDLVEYIEKCLARMGKSLTQTSRENFADIFGEIINNAEEHSSTGFRYSIGHFEDCKDNGEHVGIFQFVIFNFGDSIYEHLLDEDACKNKMILDQMRNLSEDYTKKGWFGLTESEFREETLWTLYALQDGVSCVDPGRGNGTINFIDSFLVLSGDKSNNISKMMLLSGNTRIIFDGKYKTTSKTNDAGELYKLITFNEKETLDLPPDKNYVKFADNYFPGTLIYANICIKEDNLKTV